MVVVDNKYKARIKILVKALGIERMRELVEEEWARLKDGEGKLPVSELERVKSHFTEPDYKALDDNPAEYQQALAGQRCFCSLGTTQCAHPQKAWLRHRQLCAEAKRQCAR